MKKSVFSGLVCVSLLFSAAAHAQTTINLPLPHVNDYYSLPNCNYEVTPLTTATGFTADGNYVTALARNSVACGHSGRGSTMTRYQYCLRMMWDLVGNPISVTTCPLSTPAADAGATYSLPSGYEEYTVTTYVYGYISTRYPVLVTP